MTGNLSEILEKPYALSESQKAAVVSKSRFVKIVAGAGAGKTETLTRRILYLLIKEEAPPSSIVAFTFTEKAAQSMKSRIYQRIQKLGRDDLLKQFGEMYIGTIHGFFLRLLQEKFGFADYGVLDENQEMAFVLRYGYTDIGVNFKKYGGIYSDKCSRFIETLGIVYGEMIDRKRLEAEEYDFFHSMEKYEKLLKSNRRLTFDYMSYLAVCKIKENKGAINYIKYLIVDEFQDINYSQYKAIKLISENAHLFVVGDPRQSIYQWRGSNETFFNTFNEEYPDTEEVLINENRRSVKEVVDASNKISDNFESIKYEHMTEVRPESGDLRSIQFQNAIEEAEKIANKIHEAKENGMNYSDFGVLYRSVNTSAQPLISELKKRKIPYIVGGKIGLFKRDEAQALGRLMAWLYNDGFWQTNPYTRKNSLTGDNLLSTAIELWSGTVKFRISDDIVLRIWEWKNRVLAEEFKDYKEILSDLLVILGYRNLDQDDPYDAAIMANVGRFSSLLGDFESANRYGGKSDKWNLSSELNSLCWYINAYATKAYEEQASDDISNVDAVNIMTIHQAKGLEWPTVFMPSMIKGRFPSSKSGSAKDWLISTNLIPKPERYYGGEEDEKRLFYVSTTRARDNLIISWFTKQKKGGAANGSKFLEILNLDVEKGDNFNLEPHITAALDGEEISAYSTKELIDYRRCPFHYRLAIQWFYNQGISPFMGYGETMHSCLQRAGELIRKEDLDPTEAVKIAFKEKFHLPFANKMFAAKVGSTLEEQLIQFVNENKEDMIRIREVETRIEFPLENATVTGRVDVILNDGEYLEIRDYKTSDKVITEEDSMLQVQLYALGLSYLGKRIRKGTVANVSDSIINEVGVTYTELVNSGNIAKSLINRIRNHEYNGRPSKFCEKCEYNTICRWRRN